MTVGHGSWLHVADATDGRSVTDREQVVVGYVSGDVASVVGERTCGHVDESRQLQAQIIDTSCTSSVEEVAMIEMLRIYVGEEPCKSETDEVRRGVLAICEEFPFICRVGDWTRLIFNQRGDKFDVGGSCATDPKLLDLLSFRVDGWFTTVDGLSLDGSTHRRTIVWRPHGMVQSCALRLPACLEATRLWFSPDMWQDAVQNTVPFRVATTMRRKCRPLGP